MCEKQLGLTVAGHPLAGFGASVVCLVKHQQLGWSATIQTGAKHVLVVGLFQERLRLTYIDGESQPYLASQPFLARRERHG